MLEARARRDVVRRLRYLKPAGGAFLRLAGGMWNRGRSARNIPRITHSSERMLAHCGLHSGAEVRCESCRFCLRAACTSGIQARGHSRRAEIQNDFSM